VRVICRLNMVRSSVMIGRHCPMTAVVALGLGAD
jgi:hypothetical protein